MSAVAKSEETHYESRGENYLWKAWECFREGAKKEGSAKSRLICRLSATFLERFLMGHARAVKYYAPAHHREEVAYMREAIRGLPKRESSTNGLRAAIAREKGG